jgi:hypothetical protein
MKDFGEDWQYDNYLDDILSWLKLPCPATVIGEAVTLIKLAYNGNPRRGLVATVKRSGGGAFAVSAADVSIDEAGQGANALDRYRRWIGVSVKPKSKPAAKSEELPPGTPVSFVALSNHDQYTVCRLLDATETFEFRGKGHWQLHPAELVQATLTKRWYKSGGRTMWARIDRREFNIPALQLKPLELRDETLWDPAKEYWGDDPEEFDAYVQSVLAAGPRPSFEMELILPGYTYDHPDNDPISIALDLRAEGDYPGARYKLMDLLASDLRCLDAFAHLGNFEFDSRSTGIEYYEAGYHIGELSLGQNFQGVILWGLIGNRPFLRCMNGYGLALWRKKRVEEALAIFRRFLWLNPTDNLGVSELIEDLEAGRTWEECAGA